MHVSSHGFWVFLDAQKRELFLPFREFPWFADASIRELSTIEVERGHILRWPELDVDLDIERIEHPERYPLVAGARRPRKARQASTKRTRRVSAKPRSPSSKRNPPRRQAVGRSRGNDPK